LFRSWLFLGEDLLLPCHGFPLAFPRTGIRPRPLSADRQALPVTEAAGTVDVHEALDVHLRLAAGPALAFFVGRGDRTDLPALVVVQVADPLIHVDPRLLQDVLRARPADSVDVRQADFRPLVLWQIYAGNSCHAGCPFLLTLPLFVLRILAD